MALIKCTNCGHDVSNKAIKCPKCGTPLKKVEETTKPIENDKKVISEADSTIVETSKMDKPISVSPKDESPKGEATELIEDYLGKPQSQIWKTICGILILAVIVIGGICFYMSSKNKTQIEKETMQKANDNSALVPDSMAQVAEVETDSVCEVSEFDRNNAKQLKVIKVEYINSLLAQAGNTYEAENLCDGDSTTAWAVNLDNESIYDCDMLYGPVFTVKCKKISHIIIRNGYCKNEDSFKNNTRAAKIVFYSLVDDKEESREIVLFDGALRDKPTPQRLEIPLDLDGNNDIKQIGMNFNTQLNGGYYAGKKWNDLCISEVEFWGFE